MTSRRTATMDAISLGLVAGTVAVTAVLYARLPERVPTHWGLDGEVDGWMSRAVGVWMMPPLALGVWALLRSAPLWVGGHYRPLVERSPMAAAAFLTVGLLSAVQALILWAALHPGEPAGRALVVGLGAYSLLLAEVLPRMRRNPLVGFRTGWTLASDENWYRTHRFGAYTLAVGGVIAIGCGMAGASVTVGIATVLAAMLAPLPYSAIAARSH